jgi:hypothetical protein
VQLLKRTHGSLNLVLDSTGPKIYGEGEWKVQKHGYSRHRTRRRLHAGASPDTGGIQVVVLTENSISDDTIVQDMLAQAAVAL